MNTDFIAALRDLRSRVYLMFGRGVMSSINDGGKRQRIQMTALKGEVRDQVERIQQYGFSSVPLPGAQVLFAAICGNRDHPIALAVDDPRYRLSGLQDGEVAIYNHQGTKIVLKLDGEIEIMAATKVRIDTPRLEVTGDIIDRCDDSGQSMHDMREIYNIHHHPENDSGGPTDQPNEQMGV